MMEVEMNGISLIFQKALERLLPLFGPPYSFANAETWLTIQL
jgi:hypothetical protein